MNFDQIAPASVDQLNARPTSYQEVAGSTLAVLATFFRGDWPSNIFDGPSLPSTDSRKVVVRFWQKNVYNTGEPLRGLSQPCKSGVR